MGTLNGQWNEIVAANPDAFAEVAGADGPVYGVSLRAKSEVDYHTENARLDALRGTDWQSMVSKMLPLLRKIEYSTSMRRPDLSYSP